MVLELGVIITAKKPFEDGFLNLLVVLLLEKVIMEKLDGAEHEELAAARTNIESANRTICGETDRTTGDDRDCWAVHIECGTIWIDEFEATILVALNQLILANCVSLGILARLGIRLLGFALGDAHDLLVEDTVADEGLLRVQVLVEVLPDDRIRIHTNAHLLQESINVRVQSALASFLHDD